ncbi:hypothetical protein K1T71_003583 [Dendrolimus kikuchii]|uniref:Uncharacterized protein n=1 Tax=Dendrolimus kikuchii TaxID=765133 RepID=A0ACC1DD10_9NEOP|nr:hypothetical protein K1T71_003583 [Dendrolimus kikuchii]
MVHKGCLEILNKDIIDGDILNTRLKYLQSLREQFRQRFKSEYIMSLVQKGRETSDVLRAGDVVLIETEEKRLKWPLDIT